MARYLLDTTALIDYLRGRPRSAELIEGLAQDGHELGLCCIVIAELYAGLREGDEAKADSLIAPLLYLEITPAIAKRAGYYRRRFRRQGVQLATADALIAATAVAYEATLVTANLRHYPLAEISLLELPSS